ncbi:hypothetical protein WA026_019175 [Henosepilachna vigintioctopunctata]|uniref:SAP domain-containing protein n=1 Tax=Henosepilachna vigintioctopunctata TaxID=420089 RepID=A0AAW1UTX8_9CUCU
MKAEVRKRGAKVSGLKEQLIQRLQDYDRSNDFVGSIEDEIPRNNLVYTVEWPTDNLYSSVTSKSQLLVLDIVNINVYNDNVCLTEYAAVHRKENFKENSVLHVKKTPTENKQKWHEPNKMKLNASPKTSEKLTFDVESIIPQNENEVICVLIQVLIQLVVLINGMIL